MARGGTGQRAKLHMHTLTHTKSHTHTQALPNYASPAVGRPPNRLSALKPTSSCHMLPVRFLFLSDATQDAFFCT